MHSDGFRRLLARQHGVFAIRQANDLGVTRNRLAYMVAQGEVSRLFPSVYRLAASPPTFPQLLVGAHVWAGSGSAFSHRTAGGLLGLCDRNEAMVEITTSRRLRSPDRRILLHRRAPLPPMDISLIKGLPVTTMPRTLIDMAAVSSRETVDWALDAAIRAGMRRELFLARFDDLAVPGRNGIALLRKLVGERTYEQGLPESPFERRFLRLLKSAGLPLPRCQFTIADSRFTARVDFAYPDHRLVIEADSYRWHDGRAAWEHDRARLSELASRGWRVLLVTFVQLKYKPEEVVRRVWRALGF